MHLILIILRRIKLAINKNIGGNSYRYNFFFRFKLNKVLCTTLVFLLCILGLLCCLLAIITPYSSITIRLILVGCTFLSAAYASSGMYQQPSGHRSDYSSSILGRLNSISWENRFRKRFCKIIDQQIVYQQWWQNAIWHSKNEQRCHRPRSRW